MPLTVEETKQIAEATKSALKEMGYLEVEKRNLPVTDPIVKITSDPVDRIVNDPLGGFKSGGHFYRDVVRAGVKASNTSDELSRWDNAVKTVEKTAGYMEEGDLAQGGYLVPVQVSNTILEKTLETAIVRPRATIQPMSSNRLEIPADVDNDHSTNYSGGIIIYRPGEAGQKTPKNPTFAKIALTLHKVTGLCYVSDELLEDAAIALEAYLTRKFGMAISFVEDDDFLNGTGANMPMGAFNSANPALITVDAESGQGSATIVAENIASMWKRLYPAGHGNAVWVTNIETFGELFGMSLASGTGGIPIWMPAGGISGKPFETLMGAPLIYSEKMQALGTAGDIGLADFSQYYIGQKAGGALQIASSIHIKFDYDETAFRFVLRYDGQPTWTSALTPKRGSATLSPFVVLSGSRS